MTEALSHFINDAGWLAPLYYVLSFVVTALLPFIPTPLVGALGGAAFGTLTAVAYGIVGLGLGAIVALGFARRIGRPLLLKLVTPRVWDEWEALLGIRSAAMWGVIFFVLNVDFAYLAAGLSAVSLRRLWVAAMIARFPWLVASAFFGDLIFVSDTVMVLALVFMLGMLVVLGKVRPRVHALLVRWAERSAASQRRVRPANAGRAAADGTAPATASRRRSWWRRRASAVVHEPRADGAAAVDDLRAEGAPAADGAAAGPSRSGAAPRAGTDAETAEPSHRHAEMLRPGRRRGPATREPSRGGA